MRRGRKPAERSKLAGERFNIALNIIGKTYEQLTADKPSADKPLGDHLWSQIVNVYDVKTLRTWVRQGLPERRIAAVARYFGVSRNYFTDANISGTVFEKAISEADERRGDPDGKIIPPPPATPDDSLGSSISIAGLHEYVRSWFNQGRSYPAIAKHFKKLNIDLYQTEQFADQTDSQLLAFLLVCALHSGENWGYWVRRNRENKTALRLLIEMLNTIRYDRPRLRALYALQEFPPEGIRSHLNDDLNPELRQVLETYVLNGRSIELILQQINKIPQKVKTVLKELIYFWEEKIPGFELFGMANLRPIDWQEFKYIDAVASSKLVKAAGHPELRSQLIPFLLEALGRPDTTERYWVYLTLGEIGGKRARSAVEDGCSEEDEFARLGAQMALEKLNKRTKRRPK